MNTNTRTVNRRRRVVFRRRRLAKVTSRHLHKRRFNTLRLLKDLLCDCNERIAHMEAKVEEGMVIRKKETDLLEKVQPLVNNPKTHADGLALILQLGELTADWSPIQAKFLSILAHLNRARTKILNVIAAGGLEPSRRNYCPRPKLASDDSDAESSSFFSSDEEDQS